MAASVTPEQPPAMRDTLAPGHSPSHHARLHKKASDPFLDLADADINLSDLPSPSKEPGNEGSHSESLLMDLVLTPLTMISFLLSLSLIDRQQRQWRMSQHASPESFWSRFTSWLGPEPYQDSKNGTWQHNSDAPAQKATVNTFHGWYTRKKHRSMAKMEISDAFEMRRRVLFALAAWTVLGFCALTYASRRVYGWISRA